MKRFYTFIFLIFAVICTANSQYWKELESVPAQYRNNYWLDVYVHPANENYVWVCGFNGMVIRSSDGGNSWNGSTVPNSNHLEHVHFPTLTTGYVSGPAGIHKSTDGGATWSNITPSQTADYWGCYFVNDMTGLVIGGGCVGSQNFYRTSNGGNTWELFTGSEPVSGLTDLILYNENGLGYAVSSGKLWRSTDGGRSWTVFATTGTNVWHEEITNIGSSFLLPYAGTTCSGQGGDGGMRFTTDLGVTWNRFQTGIAMFGSALVDAQNGWACGDVRSVYHTTNAGVNWRNKNCGIRNGANLDDIWMINANSGYVVGNGVYKLSPPEYKLTKDTIRFGQLCLGESLMDSLLIEHLSFDNSNAEFAIVDDPGNHFQLVSPTTYEILTPCNLTSIVVRYFPKSVAPHRARLRIILNPGSVNEVVKFVYLEGVAKQATAFPENNLLVINNVVCNTSRSVTLPWFTEGESETIVEVRKLNSIIGINYTSNLPFVVENRGSNFNFAIQLLDTGWFEERFRFTIMPCRKDTVITVRAYGVSPIIGHRSKDLISSTCLSVVYDTIRVFNTGNAPLNISRSEINPAQSGFSVVQWIDREIPFSIPVNQHADVVIAFIPLATGNYNANLVLTNNDSTKVNGNKNPYFIPLKGRSESVVLKDSLFLNLGDICLGQKKIESIQLHNTGSLDATITLQNLPIETIITINDINNRIRKNNSVTIRVEYFPNKKGAFRHVIEITAQPCNTKSYLVITGRVISNELEIEPKLISAVVKTNEKYNRIVNIKSISDININIRRITLEPEPVDWNYSFLPSVPLVLLPGQGADFNFEFIPLAASNLKGRIKIETDGICEETYFVDVDLSSFSRVVDVMPKENNFGLITCDIQNRFIDVTISNKGFSVDTISEISLNSAGSSFFIENLPELPYYIESDDDLVLRIRFTPTNEGVFTAELNIKTIGDDGQSFTIPLSGEFRKSEISPQTVSVNFGIMELCSDEKILKVQFSNAGSLTDTLRLISYQGSKSFSLDKDFWEVPASGFAEIEIKVTPQEFENYDVLRGKFILSSVVCPGNFEINSEVISVKPILIAAPEKVIYDEKWPEETGKSIITLENKGEVDIKIDKIILSDEINFKIIVNPQGSTINVNSSSNFEVEFIGNEFGEYVSDIHILFSSDCEDSIKIDLSGKVREEVYNNLVYIDKYESTAGQTIDIYVNLKDGIDRIEADRIDFEIKFDKYLFYPSTVKSRANNAFTDVSYTYSDGVIYGIINQNSAKDLLKQSGEIIQIRGLVLASIPDETDLEITKFDVLTEKALTIDKESGHLKLLDYCEETVKLGRLIMMPRFKINSGSIAHNGILKIDVNATSELGITYKIIDISGIVHHPGTIFADNISKNLELNLSGLASGNYFIIFESKYQTELISIINLK